MPAAAARRRALIRLVDAAESLLPHVSRERLRALARSDPDWHHLSATLARDLGLAVDDGVLLADNRHRLRRDGQFTPVRIYRLNRRHPEVQAALDDPDV